jgi:hypothetical protein
MQNEIYIALGLFLLTGIVQNPTVRSYFSKKITSSPGFASLIIRQRFELICKFLHCREHESLSTYQAPPKVFKIYPVTCHLNKNFQTLYQSTKHSQ